MVILPLGACQRKYLASLVSSPMRRTCSFTLTSVALTGRFLTTKDEAFQLREGDLIVEVGKMFDRIGPTAESERKTNGRCEYLFLGEQETV